MYQLTPLTGLMNCLPSPAALSCSLLMGIKTELVDVNSSSVGQFAGFAMMFGGLAQFIAGVLEYYRNTLGFVIFTCYVYGAFWASLAFIAITQFAGVDIVGVFSGVPSGFTSAAPGTSDGAKMSAMWQSLFGVLVRGGGSCPGVLPVPAPPCLLAAQPA